MGCSRTAPPARPAEPERFDWANYHVARRADDPINHTAASGIPDPPKEPEITCEQWRERLETSRREYLRAQQAQDDYLKANCTQEVNPRTLRVHRDGTRSEFGSRGVWVCDGKVVDYFEDPNLAFWIRQYRVAREHQCP